MIASYEEYVTLFNLLFQVNSRIRTYRGELEIIKNSVKYCQGSSLKMINVTDIDYFSPSRFEDELICSISENKYKRRWRVQTVCAGKFHNLDETDALKLFEYYLESLEITYIDLYIKIQEYVIGQI